MKDFYDHIVTTKGQNLKSKATQDHAKVYDFLKDLPGKSYTAWQLHDIFQNMEITSIRRTLSNLYEQDDHIIITGKIDERKGTENLQYAYVHDPPEKKIQRRKMDIDTEQKWCKMMELLSTININTHSIRYRYTEDRVRGKIIRVITIENEI